MLPLMPGMRSSIIISAKAQFTALPLFHEAYIKQMSQFTALPLFHEAYIKQMAQFFTPPLSP
jgi:hypothetical protein